MVQLGSGAILAGKYRLVRQLGKGGMGAVWYAEHLTLESPVAIKLMDPDIAANPEALARFLLEAQAAALLRSPHVVQILDYGVDEGTPYIAMEVLEGESLADRLTRVQRLSPEEVARIITHVARAIGRAHEAQIIHRDLKPDNVFLLLNDEEEVAKVLDFGIVKSTTSGLQSKGLSGTQTGALMGTPYYMSPEQAEGSRSIDHRTDIWAMGVIAFECLTGRRPFESEALGSIVLDICARPLPIPSQVAPVPEGFDAWFARACARDLDQRFGSAKETAVELRSVCGEVGPATTRSTRRPAITKGVADFAELKARPGKDVAARSMVGLSTTHSRISTALPKKSLPSLFLLALASLVLGSGILIWAAVPRRTEPPIQAPVASPTVRALIPPRDAPKPRVSFAPDAAVPPQITPSQRVVPIGDLPKMNSAKAPAHVPPGATQRSTTAHTKVNLGI